MTDRIMETTVDALQANIWPDMFPLPEGYSLEPPKQLSQELKDKLTILFYSGRLTRSATRPAPASPGRGSGTRSQAGSASREPANPRSGAES